VPDLFYHVIMSTPVVPRRDFSGMAARRLRAAEYFLAEQMTQAAIARELQISRQSVSRWYQQWQQDGTRALEGAGRAGRKPKLNGQQQWRLAAALRRGARAHGFDSDRWTLDRVTALIVKLTGVSYHRGHVWRILRGMGWTLQQGR
jgi:transposase